MQYKQNTHKSCVPIQWLHPSKAAFKDRNGFHVSKAPSNAASNIYQISGHQACDQLETKKEGKSDHAPSHAHKPRPPALIIKIYILAH